MGIILWRWGSTVAAALVIVVSVQPVAWAGTEPGFLAGGSPDGLGAWTVHYERLGSGDAAAWSVINDRIDAAAQREVQQATWDGSTRRPWTFDAAGTLTVRPTTVSEIFIGQYDTDEPNMPMQTLGSVVCDSRSGVVINWDNLFRDKTAGLARLAQQVEAGVGAAVSAAQLRDWRRAGFFAPVEVNFKYWIATPEGIELTFPEAQFGRGLKVLTVPWSAVVDEIAPEFLPIVG